MLFEEAAQNVVQQFPRIDGGKLKGGFIARLVPEDARREKLERPIAKGAEFAGAVSVRGSEMIRYQPAQIGLRDLAVVRSKPIAASLQLNRHATQNRIRNICLAARLRDQPRHNRRW